MSQPIRVSSFEQCARIAEGPPIRGRGQKEWWLDSSRRDAKLYMHQPTDDSFALRMYSTDLITYHRDGRVELQTYSSSATQPVAWAWRPHSGVSNTTHRGTMYWAVNTPEGLVYLTGGSLLAPGEDFRGTWTVLSASHQDHGVRKVADTRKMAKVRKLPFVKSAVTAVDALAALESGGPGISLWPVHRMGSNDARSAMVFIMRALKDAAVSSATKEPWEPALLAALQSVRTTHGHVPIAREHVYNAAQALFGAVVHKVTPLSELPKPDTIVQLDRSSVWVAQDEVRATGAYRELMGEVL